MISKNIIFALCLSCLSVGCTAHKPTEASAAKPIEPTIDQSSVCIVSENDHDMIEKNCKEGQKIVFAPSSWGNEQIPVYFAGANCDLRYSVVKTNGGVACIYKPVAGNHINIFN
jgi:hypothetical protein